MGLSRAASRQCSDRCLSPYVGCPRVRGHGLQSLQKQKARRFRRAS